MVAVPEDVARVIANVVTNVCQAMVDRARLEGSEYRPKLKVATTGGEDDVTILFRDNWDGIAQETMAKMFNPFFTTRDTGLGLSLVYDVVWEHAGDIRVESEPGRYTEIQLVLPKHPERKPANLAAPSRNP